eukprot:CAMPEP_0202685894 /NCGR_PEP_ID=MMETSP1385-20130828/1720_1 /ASSEMBLY_ACC=CAM_ASM_000861 /TAXON_ID=933848 /ORGANISM="Elphidium margaritaceum" /LENGTH=444 /DNA_ID=CAMNT_0049340365 /DNA_START=44 /DNA_END=1378 /DNA_ORIENTATION=+
MASSSELINDVYMCQQGSTKGGELPDAVPSTSVVAQEHARKKAKAIEEERAYVSNIHSAIHSLDKEIVASDEERKQSEMSIERQFAQVIEQLLCKKNSLIHNMNMFYDDQKQRSMQRMTELKHELSQREIALKKAQKECDRNADYWVKMAGMEDEDEKVAEPSQIDGVVRRRLSLIGTKLSKAKSLAMSKLPAAARKDKRDEHNSHAQSGVESDVIEYTKHDKMRVFMPQKELSKLIGADIRLSTEWWDTQHLNHVVYNTYDAQLWRTSAMNGGWYNAFGSYQVREAQQKKRWNLQISARGNMCGRPSLRGQPADVVFGVVDCDRIQLQNPNEKPLGFWLKPLNGFAYYGWNGKLSHSKMKNKSYGKPVYVGDRIGVELELIQTPGQDTRSGYRAHGSDNYGGVIRFFVNDEDLGIAFYDLDLTKTYSLAVALNNDAYIVSLID